MEKWRDGWWSVRCHRTEWRGMDWKDSGGAAGLMEVAGGRDLDGTVKQVEWSV